MLRIAHISDLHLAPLPPLLRKDLNIKRILGHRSWHINRKHKHLKQVTDCLHDDLIRETPDHLCVSGDMTNLGMESEFIRAKDWLNGLGFKDGSISMVPGNHDAYGSGYEDQFKKHWSEFGCSSFPYMREIAAENQKPIAAIIGLSSAVKTAALYANGIVSDKQCDELSKLLQTAKDNGLVRIVMLHHPPKDGMTLKRKSLWQNEKLHKVLSDKGADLILHGHTHNRKLYDLNGIPILDCGCSSYASVHDHHKGHYNIIEISEKKDIVISQRQYNYQDNAFITVDKEEL